MEIPVHRIHYVFTLLNFPWVRDSRILFARMEVKRTRQEIIPEINIRSSRPAPPIIAFMGVFG